MRERKYDVLDEYGKVLASNMEFQMAVIFIKGYIETFYNEQIDLRIREIDRSEGMINNE